MATVQKDKKHYKLLKTAFYVAKHQNGMAPDVFREAVPNWGFPRLSDCNNADLRAIIKRMKRWYVAHGDNQYCTQDQLDYLQLLWEIKSDLASKSSLDKYLLNNFDINHARLMSPRKCSTAIQSLKKWK